MTEYTITREDAERDLRALRSVLSGFPVGVSSSALPALRELVWSIEAQVKPAIEEPTGDVLLFVFGTVYKRQDNAEWWPYGQIGAGYEWPDLVDECRRTGSALPIVYRNEVELTELATRYEYTHPRFCDKTPNCRMAAGHNGGCES